MTEDSDDAPSNEILITDFFQANDWRFGRFAALVLTLQAIILLLVFLDGYYLVPLYLRGLLTFLFYSYIPGLVLLRGLRMHHMGGALTTLLSVAASVAIVMFNGFVLNTLYLEMNGPLPFTPDIVLVGQTVSVALLLALALVTDRHYAREPMLNIAPLLTAPAFILYSLPLVAILATYLLNGWNFAWLQIILLLLVAAVVLSLLIVRVPSYLYPVAVICIGLAVLFHTSLVSRFVVEWADISFEYWSANRTLLNGFWNMTSGARTDSVLSVAILAPMYVLLTGLDLNIVFKVFYPALLMFVPLGVFCVTRCHLGSRGALLAAFLVISGGAFFTEFLGLARQIVAELMLIAAAALLLHRSTVPVNRTILVWLLALALVVSHYGVVAVVVLPELGSVALFLVFERRYVTRSVVAKVVGSAALLMAPPILWYGNVTGSTVLIGITKHLDQLVSSGGSIKLLDELWPIFLFQSSVHLWPVFFSTILVCILCIYGLYRAASYRDKLDGGGRAYLAVAAPFLAYTFLAFLDTSFFTFISRERFLHICLLFTAPLAVFGGICASRALIRLRSSGTAKRPSNVVLGSIFVILFLVVAGVGDHMAGLSTHAELDADIISVPRHSDGSFLAANFTVETGEGASTIFADAHRAYLLDMLGGRYNPLFGREGPPMPQGTNIQYFLSSENLDGMLWLENPDYYRINKNYVPMGEPFSTQLLTMDKVYASQTSELYYKKF